MKKVCIGFSRPRKAKIGSKLIQWLEGVNFSHVFFLSDKIVYQESSPCINKMCYADFLVSHHTVDIHEFEVTDQQYSLIMDYCRMSLQAKVPYGYLQICGMAIARILNQLPFVRLRNPFADGQKTMVCSEFVGNILYIIGIEIPEDQLEIEGPKVIHRMVKRFADESCFDNID